MKTLPVGVSLLVIFCRCLAVLAACTLGALHGWAQPPAPAPSLADQKWEDIQQLLNRPAPDGRNPPQYPVAVAQARRQIVERFLRAADEARAFGENHPIHLKAREARLVEARGIMQAAMAGDVSREARGRALVKEVRGDPRLPAKARLDLVALSEIVRLRPLLLRRAEFLIAHEQSARSLCAEFPAEVGGYAALLRCAESHPDDAEGIRIARDLEALPAPENIRAAARTLLERQALVGRSLLEIARTALGEDNLISSTRGRSIILYSWTAAHSDSVAAARNLTHNGPLSGPTDARMIGVNLDHDVAAAQAAARSAGLPEDQLYDPQGLASPLAQALRLTKPGEVYVASAEGELRSVSATRGNLTAKFAAAGRRPAAPQPISLAKPGNPAEPAGKHEK